MAGKESKGISKKLGLKPPEKLRLKENITKVNAATSFGMPTFETVEVSRLH